MLSCNSSFHFVDSLALICSSEPMLYLTTLKICLWSCTLEQILAYPIDIFQYLVIIKTQRVMLNTFCSNMHKQNKSHLCVIKKKKKLKKVLRFKSVRQFITMISVVLPPRALPLGKEN